MTKGRGWMALGATLAGVSVAIGAFGAHGLKGRVPTELLAVYETGARYHFYHALALILLGILAETLSESYVKRSGWALLAGIALFSGSLYVMTLTGERWLGAVTPLGGVAFMFGWANLAWGLWKQPEES